MSDRIRAATEQQADGLARSEPAALVSLAHYAGQPVGALGRTLGLTHSGRRVLRRAGRPRAGLRSPGGGGLDALAVAAGLARPPVEAALRAVWPSLVPPDQVDAAYALDSTGQELIWIGGPLLLALLLATGSPKLPLLACAVVSVAGTAWYATGLPAAADGRNADGPAPSPLRRAGLRVLLVSAGCYGVAAGILNLALVAFAGAHGGVAWAGVLVAIWGLGSLAGGLAYGSSDWGGPVEGRAMGCLALFGAALMLLAAATALGDLGWSMSHPGCLRRGAAARQRQTGCSERESDPQFGVTVRQAIKPPL